MTIEPEFVYVMHLLSNGISVRCRDGRLAVYHDACYRLALVLRYQSRLFFVDNLIEMGAQIILCDPHRAVIVGHDNNLRLRGKRMVSPDIRAGIALLIAAMSAEGTSQIENVEQIDRGYEDIEQRLGALGAKIRRRG